MAFNFSYIKNAPNIEISKSTVFGFIRECQTNVLKGNHLLFYHIPLLVNHLCLCYFFDGDRWDKTNNGDNIVIIVDQNFLKLFVGNVFLSNIISGAVKYEWKFKLKEYALSTLFDHLDIGIWKIKSTREPRIDQQFFRQRNSGYAFSASLGSLWSYRSSGLPRRYKDYGRMCRNGDIITMILDLKNLSLSFNVNDKKYGVAFIVENTEYKAAIYASNYCTIELISSQYLH